MAEDLDYAQAQLAYSIIQDLLEHTRVVSDLIAMMAQVLDEDTVKALTQTPTWTAYLDSRRALEKTKNDVEKFAAILKELDADETDS
ncbi:MAG TPA: hypothetical protein VGP83_05450 [Pyrinomonadaceae bacterium]|jgi:hypothetical protein|nr:hypothetical protein [Pyrinomonadaceae bacterium]